MVFNPLRCGGYFLLVLAGWAGGRWVWPAGDALGVGSGQGAGDLQAGAQGSSGAGMGGGKDGGTGKPGGNGNAGSKGRTGKTVDGKAVGLELRAAGSESAFRDRARLMALEPPPALMDFLGAVSDSETVRRVLLEDAVQWAYCRDPEAGLAVVRALPVTPETATLMARMLYLFPPKDLPVLQAAYAGWPEGEVKEALLKRILQVLNRQDPRGAIALAASLPRTTDAARTHRQGALASLLFARETDIDANAAYRKLADFPAEDRGFLEGVIQSAILPSLMDFHREDAAERLATMPPEEAGPMARDLFANWASTDPIRAAPELAKLPEALQTAEIYTNFAETWVYGNAGMASQWVKDLPDGKTRDAAVLGLSGGLAKYFPTEAIAWAGSIKDGATRLDAIRNVISRTPPEAEAVMRDSLKQLNLSPESLAALDFPTPP